MNTWFQSVLGRRRFPAGHHSVGAGTALVLCLAARAAPAAVIAINNPDFEIPTVVAGAPGVGSNVLGDYTNNHIPGWMGTFLPSPGSFGVFNPSPALFTSEAPQGINVAYVSRGAIFQTLPDVLTPNLRYDLSVLVGDSKAFALPALGVELRAGAAVLASVTGPLPANDTFSLVTLSYTAQPGDPLLGEALEIWLIEGDSSLGSWAFFDDVSLTSTAVPEPGAALGVSALGLTAFALFKRRRSGR